MNRNFSTVLLCLVAATFSVHAQSNYAVVRGSILDPQHRPIQEAHIKVVTIAYCDWRGARGCRRLKRIV